MKGNQREAITVLHSRDGGRSWQRTKAWPGSPVYHHNFLRQPVLDDGLGNLYKRPDWLLDLADIVHEVGR